MFRPGNVSLDQDGLPTRVRAMGVTPSYFRLLRVAPVLGRPFTEEEGEPGNEKKVLLSDSLWKRQFGGDVDAVGRDLRLDGQPYTVVGVLPRSFEALAPGVVLWRPLAFTSEERSDDRRHSNNYQNLGRLKPGRHPRAGPGPDRCRERGEHRAAPAVEGDPENAGFHTRVERFPDRLVKAVKPMLYLLWGGAFFVLLIGCVNVANLVLVRTRIRLKELATRLALGRVPRAGRAAARGRKPHPHGGRSRRGIAARQPSPCGVSISSTCRTFPMPPTSASTPPPPLTPSPCLWRSAS